MDSMKRKDLVVGQHLAHGKPHKWGGINLYEVVILSTRPHVEKWGKKDGKRFTRDGFYTPPVTIDDVEYDLGDWIERPSGAGVLVTFPGFSNGAELVRLEHLYGPTFEEALAEHDRLEAIKKAEDAVQQEQWAAERAAAEALRDEVLGVLGYDVAHPDWTNHSHIVINTQVLADLLKAAGRL